MVSVEVIYIDKNQQIFQKHCSLPAGATVADALQQSGVLSLYPETFNAPVGIFAKLVDKSTVIKHGDRIEIYRPLTNDPKDKRRQRAKAG